MPRPARRAAIRRRGWTDGHRRQLMFGFDHLGCGWGDAVKRPYAADPKTVEREMAACWLEYGPQITAATMADMPGTRPWYWWHAEAPEPRDESCPEAIQLARLGLLEPQEQAALVAAEELLRQYEEYAGCTGTPPRRWFHLPLPTENDRQRRQLEAERSR